MMRTLAVALLVISSPLWARTLRLDYFHTGTASEERFALDALVLEGEWPGAANRLIDESGLGKYFFEVRDLKTNRVIYSRGYASIYGEWETTSEARNVTRTFHESLRFPAPAGKAQVIIRKRDTNTAFREVWSVVIDPGAAEVDRSAPPSNVKVWAVMKNGEPRDKVDLLLAGDGYTAAEMDKWHSDAKRLTEILFRVSPFKERRTSFNVWALDIASEESGVSRPSDGVYRRSPLRASYDAFGSERYVLTFDNKRFREAISATPYEFVEIVVNGRKYGGGGIFNLYATVASDNASTPYVFVHEFGHHFAGLADEYYTSDVAYEAATERPEPWEPNVSANPLQTKWTDLLTPGVPLPTPWAKDEFEAYEKKIQERRRKIRAERRPEEEMESLFREELGETMRLLGSGPNSGNVGAFEGAMYEAKGYYRAQADCIMFTRNMAGFCAACRRAINRVVDMYASR